MTREPNPLPIADLLEQRHTPQGIERVITDWALSQPSDNVGDVIADLCITVDQLVNIIHQVGHICEEADAAITAVAALTSANGTMKAALSDTAIKDANTVRALHGIMSKDTVAEDRVWTATNKDGATIIELTGTGITPRTARISPALSPEDTSTLLATLRKRQ